MCVRVVADLIIILFLLPSVPMALLLYFTRRKLHNRGPATILRALVATGSCCKIMNALPIYRQKSTGQSWEYGMKDLNQEMEGLLGEFQDLDILSPGEQSVLPPMQHETTPVNRNHLDDRRCSYLTLVSDIKRSPTNESVINNSEFVSSAQDLHKSAVSRRILVLHAADAMTKNQQSSIGTMLSKVHPMEIFEISFASVTEEVATLVNIVHQSQASVIVVNGFSLITATNTAFFELLGRGHMVVIMVGANELKSAESLIKPPKYCKLLAGFEAEKGICTAISSALLSESPGHSFSTST